MLLALAAKAKKINPVSGNSETGFFGNLLCQVFQTAQIRVDDFFAFGADEMRMRVRPVAVIAIASLRKPKLQHLIQFFKKGHGLVNRGQARRGKTSFHLFVNLLNARMPFAGDQHLQHSQPLGCNPKIVIL